MANQIKTIAISLSPSTFRLLALAGLIASTLSCSAVQPAAAQSLKHFYMARQQVQITDDAPMINDQRTFQTPGQQSAAARNLPTRPVGLPRAGFQTYYTPAQPGFNSSLPQVVNGVPPKDIEPPPMPVKKGKKASAKKLKPSNAEKTAKSTAPPVTAAKAYSPYKGYNPGAAAQSQQSTASGASNMQSKTRVKGVLHWARGH